MQRFFHAIVFTTLLASIPSAAFTQTPSSKASSIVHSAAYPNRVKVVSATYRIGIQVSGSPLSGIRITVPENRPGKFRIGQVTIADGTGQLVPANHSFNGKEVTIAFAQPIIAGTMIEINLNSVRTSDLLGRTWLFPIYGRSIGLNQEIPLGTARIQTYQ